MNEQKNNGRGIFYGVIGVATLVVAVIGATFAYFTATANENTKITGNMAEINLSLTVEQVTTADVDKGGMIPMSNGMVEPAVLSSEGKGVCLDNNDNAVCQIYRITLINDSSAGQFVDGYVALRGGSGEPNDHTYATLSEAISATKTNKYPINGIGGDGKAVGTTMRWAQVFVGAVDESEVVAGDTNEDGVCQTTAGDNPKTDDEETDYIEPNCFYEPTSFTTIGSQVLGTATEKVDFTTLANKSDPKNLDNIRTANELVSENSAEGVLVELPISGNTYNVIGKNYIRVSDHAWLKDAGTDKESFDRTADITSALVFNHNIPAYSQAVYYVAVWLTETGENQSVNAQDSDKTPIAPTSATTFFNGNVTFISAQGSEVSATFANHARVSAKG